MRSLIAPFLFAAVATSATLLPAVAKADIAPPDICSAGPGTACDNAGQFGDEPGVCESQTCYSGKDAGPGDDSGPHATADGGPIGYACVICVPDDGGTSSSSSGSSSGSTSSSSGSSSGSAGSGGGSSKSGCSLSPTQRDGTTGFVMLALGAGALVWGRRRQQP
jgi:MYXO-CTERM domain-containing protein